MSDKEKDIFVLWKGEEKKVSLQGDGVAAVIHFKPGYCDKPFKIPRILWPLFKKKMSDALMTKKCIVVSGLDEEVKKGKIIDETMALVMDKTEMAMESDINEIPEPDVPEYRKPAVSVKTNRKKL